MIGRRRYTITNFLIIIIVIIFVILSLSVMTKNFQLNTGADIPEEARDTILTVIGMAKLLMAQKLTQFRGLCDKNIVSSRISIIIIVIIIINRIIIIIMTTSTSA